MLNSGIIELVNSIADAIHVKWKKVSADVFPGPNRYSKWMVRQQWNEWNIDAYFPMNYNDFYLEPTSWIGTISKEEMKSIMGKNLNSIVDFSYEMIGNIKKQ